MEDISVVNDRMKNILYKDKGIKSQNIINVIKSDITDLLSNYFIFNDRDVFLEIDKSDDSIVFKCQVKCDKVKSINYLK